MIKIKLLVSFLCFTMIYSQSESMISYEMKMANGEGASRDFFEKVEVQKSKVDIFLKK